MPMTRIVLLAVLWPCLLAAPAAQAAGPAQTKRILRQQMKQAGPYSGAYVVDLDTGQALYGEDADVPRIPASVEKLYTSAAALLRFGADGTLTTAVLAPTRRPTSSAWSAGDLYLRGGGDPSFDAKAAGPAGGRPDRRGRA